MKNLEKLVNIRSDENCDKILKKIYEEMKDKVQEIKILGQENKIFLAGINTALKDVEPIVLAGHIDTVKANEKLYKTNPYKLTQIGDKAYGLGSIDMKSFSSIVLDNLNEIKELGWPIVFALTTDEETKLNSIEFLIETLKLYNIKPKFTILGEPTKSEFNLCSNACYEYCIKVYGKACHSSMIKNGTNAICACAKLVTFIEENQKKYNLTSNCGKIVGGEVVNKVPDYAELSFDIRTIYNDDFNNFLQDINNFCSKLRNEYVDLKIEIENKLSIPAFNMMNNQKISLLANELNIKTNSFSGGCEAGYYTQYSGDAVIFGVGDLALAHKPNEYVEIDEYNTYSQKLMTLLNALPKYYKFN